MNRVYVDPSSMSPIVTPLEGKPLLCQVHRIRRDVGPQKAALIDCLSLDGRMFCLPGHTALLSKVDLLHSKLPAYMVILPLGKVKTYFDYAVEWLDGTLEEVLAEEDLQQAYSYTEDLVISSQKAHQVG